MSTHLNGFLYSLRVSAWSAGPWRGVASTSTGIEYRKMLEVRSVEAPVSCQQPVGLERGMRPDQEIGCDTDSFSAPLPVGFPRPAGIESCFHRDGAEINPQAFHRRTRVRRRCKPSCYLGPYRFAGHQSPLRNRSLQGLLGASTVDGVRTEDIEEHAGVNSSDHLVSASPRNVLMIWSVGRRSLRIPNTASTGSLGSNLVTTRRPRSSLTSRAWPVRMPSRSRKGFGMVTCPFSETVVLIPLWYEFLPQLSNSSSTKIFLEDMTHSRRGRAARRDEWTTWVMG